jgi:hypothetical protein
MGIFEKFKSGFKKSASAFTTGLRDIDVKAEALFLKPDLNFSKIPIKF